MPVLTQPMTRAQTYPARCQEVRARAPDSMSTQLLSWQQPAEHTVAESQFLFKKSSFQKSHFWRENSNSMLEDFIEIEFLDKN